MKKQFAWFVALFLALCLVCPLLLSTQAWAATTVANGTCGENLTWVLTDDGTLTISGTGDMTSYTSSFDVPWADFQGVILSVVIEEGVTSISDSAFGGCYNLTSVSIPNSITRVGLHAFSGCSSLKLNKYTTARFLGNSQNPYLVLITTEHDTIRSCTIHKDTKVIADYAFCGRTNLTSITIPGSVEYIGDYAFKSCWNLNSVHISDGVTHIGESAFQYCTGMVSITFPNSITSIGYDAFSGCTELHHALFTGSQEQWETISANPRFAFLRYATVHYNCTGDEVDAENRYCSICGSFCSHAFSDWTQVKAPTEQESGLMERFCTICGYTEQQEFALLDVVSSGTCGENLSWKLTYDGTLTISGTGNMEDFYGMSPWYDEYERITSVVIEDGVTSIGAYAFAELSNLTDVSIPDSVTEINESAFYLCLSLREITIPNSVTAMGIGVFSLCTSLTNVSLPDSITSISDNTFSGCSSLSSFSIPSHITSIGSRAFSFCSGLTSISIPDSVVTIGDGAFEVCSSLKTITLPDRITAISDSAFSNCSSLENITIPDSVTTIGNSAFSGCTSLEYITIPESVTYLGDHIFSCCTSLQSITIPSRVTYLGDYAFFSCTTLKHITLPNGITTIGAYTFYNCSSLENITLPYSITCIEYNAFERCSGLTSIIIPPQVTQIGDNAFGRCDGLTSIVIPRQVEQIGDNAFADCPNLWHVLYLGTPSEWNYIDILAANDSLLEAVLHFQCTGDEIVDLESKICTVCCGEMGHAYGEWTDVATPAGEETGLSQRICNHCGKVEQKERSKLELLFSDMDSSRILLITVVPTVFLSVLAGLITWLVLRKKK